MIISKFAAKILLFIQLCKYIEQKMYFFIQYSIFIVQIFLRSDKVYTLQGQEVK